MLKLAKAGAAAETDTTLTTNENTRHFLGTFARNGDILYSLIGSFNSATITLQVSYDGGSSFATYAAPDATGTLANVTHTAPGNFSVWAPGQLLRFACTSGTSPDIDIQIAGDVTLMDKT